MFITADQTTMAQEQKSLWYIFLISSCFFFFFLSNKIRPFISFYSISRSEPLCDAPHGAQSLLGLKKRPAEESGSDRLPSRMNMADGRSRLKLSRGGVSFMREKYTFPF